MVRLVLSIIIFTLLITYAVIPFVKYLRRFFKAEAARIEKSLQDNRIEKDEEQWVLKHLLH